MFTKLALFRNYFNLYDQKVSSLFRNIEKANENMIVDDDCRDKLDALDFDTTGYSVSYIRDELNENLPFECYMDNRKSKVLLIKHFSENICFIYPTNRKVSQMVYSSSFVINTVVETLRQAEKNRTKRVALE